MVKLNKTESLGIIYKSPLKEIIKKEKRGNQLFTYPLIRQIRFKTKEGGWHTQE